MPSGNGARHSAPYHKPTFWRLKTLKFRRERTFRSAKTINNNELTAEIFLEDVNIHRARDDPPIHFRERIHRLLRHASDSF
jgi:hypothetical protein